MNKAKEKADPASGEGTISTRSEQKQVEERVAMGAHVVYETIRREGEEELQRTASAMEWSGLAAGLSMGFSFIAEGVLVAHLPDQLVGKVIGGVSLVAALGHAQVAGGNERLAASDSACDLNPPVTNSVAVGYQIPVRPVLLSTITA